MQSIVKTFMNHERTLPALLCLALLTAVLAAVPAAADAPRIPNWQADCADGSTVDLHAKLAEGPVVISFWALWCKPCLKELPHLDAMATEYAGRVSVLAVNIDSQRSVAKVAPYLQAQGYSLTVPLDTAGDISRLTQVGGQVPFVALLDADGREVYRHLGYKEGDELELRERIERLLNDRDRIAKPMASGPMAQTTAPVAAARSAAEQVSAVSQLEYSYSTETSREIVENWLDVSYYLDGFRTGILVNSRQPSEEGLRENEIRHRFFEFSRDGVSARAGHFYGMFGRGLVFAAYEDRTIRVDTALEGVLVGVERGRAKLRAFTGTPSALDIDVRGADAEIDLGHRFVLGASGLTYQAPAPAGVVNREYVTAVRLRKYFAHGDFYLEHGWKRGYDFEDAVDEEKQAGRAFYGSANLYGGPFSLALEAKSYDRFAVLRRADGKVSLNNPPALTREHLYTLLSRNTHNLDADDEVGGQAELSWQGPRGWGATAAMNRTENRGGDLLFEEAYAHVEKEKSGTYRLRGAYGYQDASLELKGENHFFIGEATWDIDTTRSLMLQLEHQHVKLGPRDQPALGGVMHPGAFDVEMVTLEYAQAPHWTFAAMFETNNKVLPEQRTEPGEKDGPFPAGTVTYATADGGSFSLWFGKRQAGQLCTGGVCKREPAFEGAELFWVLRY